MYTFHQIGLDSGFCTDSRFFSRDRELEVEGTATVSSFLRNHRKQERLCASSLCNYHVHHICNVHRCSFISLFVHHLSQMPMQFVVAGDVKRSAGGGSVTTS